MILVTGGTGLVGSHLLYRLVQESDKIRAIYRNEEKRKSVKTIFSYYTTPQKAKELYEKITWCKADVNDLPALEAAFAGVTRVYHCAALVSFRPTDERQLRKTNIKGTANIANLSIAHGVEKLCYVSSIASLGKSMNSDPITEKTVWNPEASHTDYAISKYGAEIEVWRASQEGVAVVIVNPGIIIGPGFWQKGSGPIFSRIAKAKGLNYYFTKTTGFVGVKDVIEAMKLLMDSEMKNEKYILVAENRSFKYVLQKAAKSIGKPAPKVQLKKWMLWSAWFLQKAGSFVGVPRQLSLESVKTLFQDVYYNNQKIKEDLDFEFTPIERVIEKTGSIFKKEVL